MERNILKSALIDSLIGGNKDLQKEFESMVSAGKNNQRGLEEFDQALLLSASILDKEAIKKIRIVKTPVGPAPDEIKNKWIGVELIAIKIPEKYFDDFNFLTGEIYPERGEAYGVYVSYAINKLQSVSPEAAEWFRKNVPQNDAIFGFGAQEVEIVG